MKRHADNLRYASEVLDQQRFAGLDQNPKGIRDLIGSAAIDVAADQLVIEQLLKALATIVAKGKMTGPGGMSRYGLAGYAEQAIELAKRQGYEVTP